MHKLNRPITKIIVLLALISLSGACAPRYEDNHYESPFEYYLYVPENYRPDGGFPLFVALHGWEQDGADCYEEWLPYARAVRFMLVCPTMPMDEDSYDIAQAEVQLAAILSDLYSRYNLVGKFFLAGYNAGADFALPYTYRYPSAIFGVAVIGPTQLPSPATAYNIPTLLFIDEEQSELLQAAETFTEVLQGAGYTIRLVVVSGLEESLGANASRTSVELYRDLTY